MVSQGRRTRTRMRWILVLSAVVFAAFAARLFQIQAVDASTYAKIAIKDGSRKTPIPAPRGTILDRNGVALASSANVLSLTADPTLTGKNAPRIARILLKTLGSGTIDYFDTIERLQTPKTRFVIVAKNLQPLLATKAVNALSAAKLPGVYTVKGTIRTYPSGSSLASNVLGFANSAGVGVAGLERSYNAQLTGRNGSTTFETSPSGTRIPMADSTVKKMIPGSTIKTTIDRDLQYYADQQLASAVKSSGADWGVAVTMDVKTCQIVQLSQVPRVESGQAASYTTSNSTDHSVSGVYEPGSVMKTVTMAALADQGKITADSKITVPSSLTVDGFTIGDDWTHGVLHLTAAGVIAKSSNLGTITAANQMSNATFYSYLKKFGFGHKTGIQLPAESAGILTPLKDWTKAKHATVAFGQGISVNAIQMIRAVGAIANGGVMCNPSLVESTTNANGTTTTTKTHSTRVVSRSAAAQVTAMMEAVTTDEGTGPMARISGYNVAGKTGTAWRVNPVTGRYVHGENTVSFMGYAPADNPRFITYVVIDKPHADAFGGTTAGPVFQKVMSMALQRFGVAPTGAAATTVPLTW